MHEACGRYGQKTSEEQKMKTPTLTHIDSPVHPKSPYDTSSRSYAHPDLLSRSSLNDGSIDVWSTEQIWSEEIGRAKSRHTKTEKSTHLYTQNRLTTRVSVATPIPNHCRNPHWTTVRLMYEARSRYGQKRSKERQVMATTQTRKALTWIPKMAFRHESPCLRHSREIAAILIQWRFDWCMKHAVELVRRYRNCKNRWRHQTLKYLPVHQKSALRHEFLKLRRSKDTVAICIEWRFDWSIEHGTELVRRYRNSDEWRQQHRQKHKNRISTRVAVPTPLQSYWRNSH